MQIKLLRQSSSTLATVFVVLFLFSISVPSYAAEMIRAPHFSMEESMSVACDIEGCAQKHIDCDEHCLGESNENQDIIFLHSEQGEDLFVADTQLYFTIVEMEEDQFSLIESSRGPPRHIFLRSVLKRE